MRIQQLTVGSMAVCCYLLSCEESGQAIVIDPGGDHERILALIASEKVTLRYIVNTHGHPDHVCANGPLQGATGAEIVMHAEDAAFFGRPEVEHYFSMLGLAPSPPPDKLVAHGDHLQVGTMRFTILHTPGHTPGGICLYAAPHLFSGDTLFVGAVGRTDFPGGDHQLFMRSIREQLLTLPDETVVWPGHGYGGLQSTIGEEKRGNPFLNGEF